jgi:hypothetical protein
MPQTESTKAIRRHERVALYRQRHAAANRWAAGYGPIQHTVALGFINHGGTLNTAGMLFVNRCTWVHIVAEVACLLDLAQEDLLSPEERATLEGKQAPAGGVI